MSMKKPIHAKHAIWRRPQLWVLLLLAAAGVTGAWFTWGKVLLAQSSASPTALVTAAAAQTGLVTKGSLTISAAGSGTLQAGQTPRAARVGGGMNSLFVEPLITLLEARANS